MPRFVVLEHDHPGLHWDFLLEEGDHLRGWRLVEAPHAGGTIAAKAMADHRLLYLDYQGPVSGGRGEVRRWDAGEYSVQQSNAAGLSLRLQGRRFQGTVMLQCREGQEWLAAFHGEMDASGA
jgi:hypothetical protein